MTGTQHALGLNETRTSETARASEATQTARGARRSSVTVLATLCAVLAAATGCNGEGNDDDAESFGQNMIGFGNDDAGDRGDDADADAGGSGSAGSGPFFDVLVGDEDIDEGGCAAVEVTVDQATPTVMLLIDQSGSMTSNFGGRDRWDAVDDTLFGNQNGVVFQLEDSVRFGLALYTSHNGFGGGTCPIITSVDAELGNANALAATYAQHDPDGDTPTGESIEKVADQLAAMNIDGPVAIVVATDGEPDTCDQPNPQNGQQASLDGAEYAQALGIDTYVISVGNDVSDAHLQELANAGKGLAPSGSTNAPFYKALDADDLVDAFSDIAGDVISCDFTVDGLVDVEEACAGDVRLDGESLACGTEWEMADASTLRLLGDACTTLKDGDTHDVDATFPCGVFNVP